MFVFLHIHATVEEIHPWQRKTSPSIFQYAPESAGAQDYAALALEVQAEATVPGFVAAS